MDNDELLLQVIARLDDAFTTMSQNIAKIVEIQEQQVHAIKKFDQHQRTIMVGWNSLLEHAGMHLNNLFRGKVPAPLLRKLIEASFRDEPKHVKTGD